MQIITYGIGGFDEMKPNNNIIEIEIIDDPEPSPLDIAIEKLEKLGFTQQEAIAIINGGA